MLSWDSISMQWLLIQSCFFLFVFFQSWSMIVIIEKLKSLLNLDERLQSISWCSFNFTSVRKELKNINWLISRRNHSVLHTVSSCLMYFWMTWEFVSWISTIFIYILFMSFKFWYVQYFKLTRWASFSFHTYSCWFTIKFIISMFTHVVIWKKDRLKSVSVTNHLQDFLFMILNRLMILNIWIIFLCISFMINQFHLIFQNFHIDCDCFALELAFWK